MIKYLLPLFLSTLLFSNCVKNTYYLQETYDTNQNIITYGLVTNDKSKVNLFKSKMKETNFINFIKKVSYKKYVFLKQYKLVNDKDLHIYIEILKNKHFHSLFSDIYLNEGNYKNRKRYVYKILKGGCSRKYNLFETTALIYLYYRDTKDTHALLAANKIGGNYFFHWFKTFSKNDLERLNSYKILYFKYNKHRDNYIKSIKVFLRNNVLSDQGWFESLILLKLEPTSENANIAKRFAQIIVDHFLKIGDFKRAEDVKIKTQKAILQNLKF